MNKDLSATHANFFYFIAHFHTREYAERNRHKF